MYAIIKIGGKQYKIRPGNLLRTEKVEDVKPGETYEVKEVLAVSDEKGNLKVGKPFVDGASVVLKKIEDGRGKKIIVFKFKTKKRYRRKYGHRQWYSLWEVQEIKGV